MDLHELTTAQRKLAQQQLKDIQKGGKKKVQNASDKYSDKYFNANTTNKAMAAGRAKDKSLAAAADERVKSARNDARKAQADKLRRKKAERQGDLKRADSTLRNTKVQKINSQEPGSESTKKVTSNFFSSLGSLAKAGIQATGTDRKVSNAVGRRLKRFNQSRKKQRGLSTGTSDKQLRALDAVKQRIQAKKRGETKNKPPDPWRGNSTVSRKQPGSTTGRTGAVGRALTSSPSRKALPPSRSSALAVRGVKPGQKRLPGAGQTGSKPGDLGKAARKDPKLRAKLIQQRNKGMKEEFSNWREEFIWEVDKKEKAPKMVKPMSGENTIIINPDSMKEETISEKKGLWDNIHARRKAGKAKRKPGDKNYPKTLDID